jgi:2-desacetyl-2-hydroxyethyl bacteriochlorophyllide A dehydrogenase
MKALSIVEPGKSRVETVDRPQPEDDEVLIRVSCCGICGTDVHILQGEYIGSYPITPGHEFSGTVEAVGPEVTTLGPGDRVAVEPNLSCGRCEACLTNRQNFCEHWQGIGVTLPGGMAEYAVAPESAVFDIGDLPYEVAAFMEPLSCVLHGVSKLTIAPGARVAVIGAGPIGIQLVRVLRTLGAGSVVVVDRNEDRLNVAREDGAAAAHADVRELPSDRFDVVVEATGVPALVPAALDAVRSGGEVLLFGVSPQGRTAEVEPFTVFRKGLSIHGSYTSLRNSFQALELLATGRVRVEDLISHRLSLDQFEHGVSLMETGGDSVMKVMMIPA